MNLLAQFRRRLDSWRTPKTLGKRGEQAAERYLKKQGYIIVARGQRDKLGELDLVAVDGRTVVFVEVKTRKSTIAGHPADAVDEAKQRRVTRLALSFLRRHELLENKSRFDIISVLWPDAAKKPKIEHFINAFEAIGQWQMFS